MTTFDGHICSPPVKGRAHWWTCEQCGQLWRLDEDRRWRLSGPEGPAPIAPNVHNPPANAAQREQESR